MKNSIDQILSIEQKALQTIEDAKKQSEILIQKTRIDCKKKFEDNQKKLIEEEKEYLETAEKEANFQSEEIKSIYSSKIQKIKSINTSPAIEQVVKQFISN